MITHGVVTADGVVRVEGDTTAPLPWASLTKPCTAIAVLVAVEDGSLSLDQPAGPPGSTLRHLLAHASGYDFDTDAVLAAPATRRIYSNTGYERAAEVLVAATGIDFDTYLREAVLQPLGCTRTTLHGTAAAGLVGPLDDLLRVAGELLRPTLLAPATASLLRTVAFPGLRGVLPGFGPQDHNDWALGPEIRDHKAPHWTGAGNSPETFGHFGGGGGFVWVDPAVAQVLLARVHAKAEVLKLMNWRIAAAGAESPGPAAASATKLYGTELAIEVYRLLMEVLGPAACIREGSPGALLHGRIERMHRSSLILTFGGGTNEVQRDIIAAAALGLPTARR